MTDVDDLLGRPWVGASWEGFVIEQCLSALAIRGVPHDTSYFRTSDGYEVNLVLDFGAERWAIEVKLTTTPSTDALRSLTRAADLFGADRRYLVTRTPDPVLEGSTWSCRVEHVVDEIFRRSSTRRA